MEAPSGKRSVPLVDGSAWMGSSALVEDTLHRVSPYIGKVKSTIAATLIGKFTQKGDTVLDPFSGSGTIALEAWKAGCNVVASDLSPYATLLTRAKLNPLTSLDEARRRVSAHSDLVRRTAAQIDLRSVASWVRAFFHPDTLREALAWTAVLTVTGEDFLLACLMGILHHQRPGFLSYPSSHTVPYLRTTRFPRSKHPKLYQYRTVQDRLERKLDRAFARMGDLDFDLSRRCLQRSATQLPLPTKSVDAIVTSPPYMRQLDYARDNRLRLWFLGTPHWKVLETRVSPGQTQFMRLMKSCFAKWANQLRPGAPCVLIMGDTCSRSGMSDLPELVAKLATDDVRKYQLLEQYTETIPHNRRVRRGLKGSSQETILVLERTRNRS